MCAATDPPPAASPVWLRRGSTLSSMSSASFSSLARPSGISIPGTFRKVKTKCFGPTKMTNDPLDGLRAEITAYDTLLKALSSTAQTVHTAVEMLGSAPIPLFDPLRQFYGQESCSPVVARMCAQLEAFASKQQQAAVFLSSMQELIQEISKDNATTRETFTARDLAWQTQSHYNGKVDSLQEQVSRAGSTPKLNDKLNRNVQKKRESDDIFERAMSDAEVAADRLLSSRWKKMSQILRKFCRYYISLFEASQSLAQDFRELSEEFIAPAASEAACQSDHLQDHTMPTLEADVADALQWVNAHSAAFADSPSSPSICSRRAADNMASAVALASTGTPQQESSGSGSRATGTIGRRAGPPELWQAVSPAGYPSEMAWAAGSAGSVESPSNGSTPAGSLAWGGFEELPAEGGQHSGGTSPASSWPPTSPTQQLGTSSGFHTPMAGSDPWSQLQPAGQAQPEARKGNKKNPWA